MIGRSHSRLTGMAQLEGRPTADQFTSGWCVTLGAARRCVIRNGEVSDMQTCPHSVVVVYGTSVLSLCAVVSGCPARYAVPRNCAHTAQGNPVFLMSRYGCMCAL